MKRIKMFATIATIGAAMLTSFGAWADTWTDGDGHVWTYSINAVSATVSAVTDAEYDLEIPATLGGKPVVAFGTIFKGNTKISEIVIPNGVTAIAAQAFDGCSQLQRVTVGSGVTSVGNYAFRNCALLQKIELPEATTTLGTGAFAYCVKLNTAKLPGVTSIPGADDRYSPSGNYFAGYGSFYGCDKLRTLELGENLTSIGNGAFYNCNELYDLVIPDSVTTVGKYAFAECDKLHSVTLGAGVTTVKAAAFADDTELEVLTFNGTSVKTLEASAFYNCQNLQSLTLPDGLLKIGIDCFAKCANIQSVVIPDSVTSLTNGAFANCTGLFDVKLGMGIDIIPGAGSNYSPSGNYFAGEGVFYGCTALTNISLNATLRTIGNGAFYGCSALPALVIPDSVRTIGNYAFAECGLLRNVIIGDGVRLIGNYAFYNDAKLETLVLGAKVQTINAGAFQNCTALVDFTFPDTVLTIGADCFKSCRSLISLSIPDSVGVVGTGSFAYCTRLATVSIGDGLEEISGAGDGYSPSGNYFAGYGAFYGCTALTNITIGTSVATIGNGAFYNCSSLPSITIPSCVSTIGDYAFANNTALTTLTIQNGGVTSIGTHAFDGDAMLVAATLGDRLVTIGAYAFQGCARLTGLVLPDSLITIGGWSFTKCNSLIDIVIPGKVKDLNSGAFANCTGLRTVKIGKMVQIINGAGDRYSPSGNYFAGYGAFYGCTALTSVDLGSTLAEIATGAFYGCSALPSITIPDSVTKIGGYAFGACTSLRCATLGSGVATMGNNVFNGDTALHYVEYKGDAPTNMGSSIYNGTKERMTTYVPEDSTGWTALYQPGLPGTWQGRAIAYAPPPANADAPYDFYPCTRTDTINWRDYAWPGPIMITTNRYVYGKTIPATETVIREGDPVYLSCTFDEYWRSDAFDVTNRFTLTGAKSGAFEFSQSVDAHSTAVYWWKTNAVPELLQNLEPGEYTLTLQLNGDSHLKETDYANNTTSITFTVVGAPRYTVTFDLNGASGTAPDARTVYEGKTVGELPEVTAPAGWTFLGWFTAATGGTKAAATTKVTVDTTLYAQWSKCDIGFYVPTGDDAWGASLFVTTASGGTSPMTTITEGSRIYLKYAFRNLAGAYDMRGFVNRFELSTGATFEDGWLNSTLSGTQWGWGGAAWYPSVLQNLAPGTYALTCKLDATGQLSEVNEGNNQKSITFTVTAKDVSCVVTFNANGGSVSPATRSVASGAAVGTLPTPTRIGYAFAGWWTAASGGTQITSATKVTSSVTYYARWTALPTYTVTYKPGAYGKGSQRTATKTKGVALTLEGAIFTRSGYKQSGWATSDGGSKAYNLSASYTANAGITLYPAWRVAKPGTIVASAPTPLSVKAGETLRMKFARQGGSDGKIAVKAKTQTSTALMGVDGSADFDYVKEILEWGDGDASEKYIDVPTYVKPWEGTKQLRVKLSTLATGAYAGNLVPKLEVAKIYVDLENPSKFGTVSVTAENQVAGEPLRLAFRRAGGSSWPIAVKYKVQTSTAVAGVDFEYVKDVITWGDGESGVKYVEVPTYKSGSGKTLRVKLSTLTQGAHLGCVTPHVKNAKVYMPLR